MTPQEWAAATVRIATELLGWERTEDPEHGIRYAHRKGNDALVTMCADGITVFHAWSANLEGPDWPDLTTRDECAEFEAALAERGWILGATSYWYQLWSICKIGESGEIRTHAEVSFLATPEQRVRACLAVLDAKEGK